MIDFIVPHYTEPFVVGKKFFDMLGAQNCIDFEDLNVILVHDGVDPFPGEYFTQYPFTVEQIRIEHAGVSAARNAGIEHSKRKWVMFCDFDDMFSNCFAIKTITGVLNTNSYDVLWCDFWAVDKSTSGDWIVNQRGENVVFIHGKLFRRKYLLESGLRFDTGIEFNEDSLFCTTAIETLPKNRVGHIETAFPPYVWCYTENSSTTDVNKWRRQFIGAYMRNKKCVELFKGKDENRYQGMIARLVWDAYNAFNLETVHDDLKPYIDDFREFYKENKNDFWMVDPDIMQEVKEISRAQYSLGEQEALRRWGEVPMKRKEGVNIKTWLNGIETGVY